MQILSPKGISSALLALLLLALTPAQGPPPSLGTSEQLILCPGELVPPSRQLRVLEGDGQGYVPFTAQAFSAGVWPSVEGVAPFFSHSPILLQNLADMYLGLGTLGLL